MMGGEKVSNSDVVEEQLRIIDEVVDGDNEIEKALAGYPVDKDQVVNSVDVSEGTSVESQFDPELQFDDSVEEVLKSLRALPNDLKKESYADFLSNHAKVLADREVTKDEVKSAIEALRSPLVFEDLKKILFTIEMLGQLDLENLDVVPEKTEVFETEVFEKEIANTIANLKIFYFEMAAPLFNQLKSASEEIATECERLEKSKTTFREYKRGVLNNLWLNVELMKSSIDPNSTISTVASFNKAQSGLCTELGEAKKNMEAKAFSNPFKKIIADLVHFLFGKELFPNKTAELVRGLGDKCSGFFSKPEAEHSVQQTPQAATSQPAR